MVGDVMIKDDQFYVEARLYEEPRPAGASMAVRCDCDYDSVFGTFVDPKQQQAASESVLQALQDAGIDLSGISSIEFEAGSIVVRVEADEATQRAIAALAASGRLNFSFQKSTRRGPSRETAWQPQDAAKYFDWYKPGMARAAATDVLRDREAGDFVVYTRPSAPQRGETEGPDLLTPEPQPAPVPDRATKPKPEPEPEPEPVVVAPERKPEPEPELDAEEQRKRLLPAARRVQMMARVVRRGQKLGAFVDDSLLDVDVDQQTRIIRGLREPNPTLRRKSYGERMFPSLQGTSTTDDQDDAGAPSQRNDAADDDDEDDVALPGQTGAGKKRTSGRRAYEASLLATELTAIDLKPSGATQLRLPGEPFERG